MKKINYLVALACAVLVLGLVALNPTTRAGAMSSSGGGCSNNGVRPSPYTGGAGVTRVFYPADGSTVTITTTGAVIKQSPCQTPYREGWVNPANTCSIDSADDISGQIKAGATNPFTTDNNRTPGCSVATSTSTSSSSSTNSSSSSSVLSASTTHKTATSTPQTTAATTSGKSTVLPNTGPGDVIALGGVSTFLGTIGHLFYRRFRRA